MADDPGYIKNLRTITRAEPQFIHLEALEREFYDSGSDRNRRAVGIVKADDAVFPDDNPLP